MSRRASVVLRALFVVVALAAAARAQSGRRVRSGESGGTPTAAPVVEPPKPAPAKRVLPKVALVVAGHVGRGNDSAETIVGAFIKRLGESMSTTSLGLVKHEEAERRARAETENYVVWLQLERDAVQNGQILYNSPDYVIDYSVLAPRTAKVLTKGTVYYQPMGGARGRSGDDKVIRISPDAAGEAAADMMLDWLAFYSGRKVGR